MPQGSGMLNLYSRKGGVVECPHTGKAEGEREDVV